MNANTTLQTSEVTYVNPAGETWGDLSQDEVMAIVAGPSLAGKTEAESGAVCSLTVECPWVTEFWCC